MILIGLYEMICVAFLTIIPNKDLIEFAIKLATTSLYNIYIFIDNNDYVINDYLLSLSSDLNIKFIKIDNNECYNNHYKFTQEPFYFNMMNNMGKCVNSWDKCLYYFCKLYDDYDYLWIIEDDVLVPSINILNTIDLKYNNSDLLTQRHELGTLEQAKNNEWFWFYCSKYFNEPYYKSMVCCCRISKKLLMKVKEFVEKNKFIILNEFIFNTIAHQSNMIINNPIELSGITFNNKWKKEDFNINTLYHPVKDFSNHNYYRDYIIR